MNDPKELIDGLFNSMIGDEPEADQPETAECPVCADTFLAGTANESGWCEDCEGNWPPEHQEPDDTVGAPIMADPVSPEVREQMTREAVAFQIGGSKILKISREAAPDTSHIDEWCTDEKCCNPPGYHFHGPPLCPSCNAPDAHVDGSSRESVVCSKCEHAYEPQPLAHANPGFQVEAYQARNPGAVVVDKTHAYEPPAYESPAPDQRYGTAEAEVARDAEANRAAMEKRATADKLAQDAKDEAAYLAAQADSAARKEAEAMTYSQGDEFEVPPSPPASVAVEHLEDLVDNLETQNRELTQRVEALESRLGSLLNGFADAIHSLR